MCGQSAHIHRDFWSIGHDVLHSVFHLDGKFWRTIPELAFHPGRLTRRYIEGERAKFISPMALFLFTVFAMYAVFAFVPDLDWNNPPPFTVGYSGELIEEEIAALRRRLDTPGIDPAERVTVERELASLELALAMWQPYEGALE